MPLTIIDAMKRAGYLSTNPDGICHGLALTAAQACLREDARSYVELCNYVRNPGISISVELESKRKPFFETISIYHGITAVLRDVASALGLSRRQTQWSRITLFQATNQEINQIDRRTPHILFSSMVEVNVSAQFKCEVQFLF